MMVLCGKSCDSCGESSCSSKKTSSKKKGYGSKPDKKADKKTGKKSSKKKAKKEKKDDDDIKDLAFLDNLSSRRARETEDEIRHLIAMIENENKALDGEDAFDKPYQTVLFESGATDLNNDQLELVRENKAKAAEAAKSGRLLVVRGHSDAIEAGYNDEEALVLAKRRADAVKDELVSYGVPAQQVETVAVGSSEPISYNFDKEQEDLNQPNRRVEIITI